MKALRAKRLKKLLLYYKVHYGIEPPFRVIVDGSFMLFALEKKLYFREQLPKVLQAKAMPMVTKCIVSELRKNEDNDRFGAALMAKRLEHVPCGHDDHPISASECVKSVLAAQPNTFLIATQNGELQKALERIPGVPTLFFFNNVLTIVKPSNFERNMAGLMDKRKGYAAPEEKELARKTQKELREVDMERQKAIDHLLRAVKPKAKGPNPLSVMKSKKAKGSTHTGIGGEKKKKKKRKRNRTRSGIKKEPVTDAMDVSQDVKDEKVVLNDSSVPSGAVIEEKKKKKKRHRKRKRTRGGVKRRKISEENAVDIESADEVDSSFSGASSSEDDSSDDSASDDSSASSSAEEEESDSE